MSESPNPALALLEFERRIQSATSNREVAFRAVNDASQVLDFDQAVLWRLDVFGRPLIAVASGLADVSADSPFQQWLVRLVQSITPAEFDQARAWTIGELPEAVVTDGAEWCPAHLLHCPLRGPTGTPLGGMLFLRGTAFQRARACARRLGGALDRLRPVGVAQRPPRLQAFPQEPRHLAQAWPSRA
jgi:hypothetical protein